MKKFFFSAIAACIAITVFLSGCQSGESENKNRLNLLFSVAYPEAKENALFFIPLEKGFLYFSDTGNGTNCGFVDIASSKVTESVFVSDTALTKENVSAFSVNSESACVLTPEGTYLALTVKGGAKKYERNSDIPILSPAFYDGVAYVFVDSGLLLMTPYDFSEEYVISSDSIFSENAVPLTVSGKNIYFTAEKDGKKELYRTVYNENTIEKMSVPEFFAFSVNARGGAVFAVKKENENFFYTLDGASANVVSAKYREDYSAFSLSGDGNIIACLLPSENGDSIDILSSSTGTRLARFSAGERHINPNFAFSSDSKSVIYSILPSSSAEKGEIVSFIDIDALLK